MMEESSRFLTLSGLSGILVGIYALIGSFLAYQIISTNITFGSFPYNSTASQLIILAVILLIVSLFTVLSLTYNKAKKAGKKIWNPGSRLMLLNLSIPLVSGGLLILIFLIKGVYEIAAPGCLIFYGLALINAAKFTRQEIFYLGLLQLTLGILAAVLPSLGLFIWALGFGVLHIVYGILMYYRYERQIKG